MSAQQIIFALSEAHRVIDSEAFVGLPEDAEIVKADLLRAIKSIENIRNLVMAHMVAFTTADEAEEVAA